ncbi:hypothetical protein ABZ508_34190 [Streptomyces lavendulocolor]|uniref:TrbL/VirB6 plasmid conjugal transfer protein n=1 Tax=Streptomyces lavendulocolor TaxID=67316 RepID=A0ABV2WGC8_9ACTN
MTRSLLARLAATLGALLLVVGLGASPATAAPLPAAVPAAAPHMPPSVDWWGIGKCATWFIPNAPKAPSGPIECAKTAIKGGKAVGDAGGKALSTAAQKVADSVLGDAAKSMAEFVGEFMRVGFGWWLMTDSVQVKDSGVLGDTKDPTKQLSLHALMVGIGAGIATILAMFQGIRMIMQRKGAPLGQLLQGLMINVLVSAAGVGVIDALLIASDQLTKSILYVGFGGGDVPDRMATMLLPAIANPMGLLAISLIVLIIGGIQLVMLFLRQAAIPIQALLLPIAGAGQVGGDNSRQWLPRLFTAIMVIITYKPMAALIISVGFTEMANGNGIIDFVRGVVTLALSVIALKSLLALFAPIGLSMGNAVTAGGGLGGALSMAGSMLGSRMDGAGGNGGGGGSTSATQHAADMDRNGPAANGGGGDNSGEGSSAITQASIPKQGGSAAEGGSAAVESGAEAAATTATEGTAATGTATAGATTTATSATPVGITLVAAEAGKAAVDKAGGSVGGKE